MNVIFLSSLPIFSSQLEVGTRISRHANDLLAGFRKYPENVYGLFISAAGIRRSFSFFHQFPANVRLVTGHENYILLLALYSKFQQSQICMYCGLSFRLLISSKSSGN